MSVLGPYAKFVREDGAGLIDPSGLPNSIAYDVLRHDDYVRYFENLLNFADIYIIDLTNTQVDCIQLASALVTISKLKNGTANSLLTRVINRYDYQLEIANIPSELDLDALLSAVRLAIELHCSVDRYGLLLTEALEIIAAEKERELVHDAISVLINHQDVLRALYDGRLDVSIAHRLDDAVQALEQS